MRKHLAVFVSCLATSIQLLNAESPVIADSRRAKIEGLSAVSVYVDHYAGEEGDAQRLKTEVELRLRQAGIQIKADAPTLMLGRSSRRDSGGALVRSLQAEMQETGMFLRGDAVRRFPVVTWESTLDGQKKVIKSDDWFSARKEFMAVVDEFLNDHMAANQASEVTARKLAEPQR